MIIVTRGVVAVAILPALVLGAVFGVYTERYLAGTVGLSLSREADGVRCNVDLERADGE